MHNSATQWDVFFRVVPGLPLEPHIRLLYPIHALFHVERAKGSL